MIPAFTEDQKRLFAIVRLANACRLNIPSRLAAVPDSEVINYMAEQLERQNEAYTNLANECRRKVEIQIALRVEAQARSGRLARDARR